MEIKKFWKFYPVVKNKNVIANSRVKVSKKKEESFKSLEKNILMEKGFTDMVVIIIIKNILGKLQRK